MSHKSHTTTRSPSKDTERLKSLCKSKSTVYEANLLTTDFTPIFSGCDVIFHTASPFFIQGANEENVVKPAVEGTANIFLYAQKANVQNIVLTSSTASIYAWYGTKPKGHVMTEEDWSNEPVG